MENQLSDVLNVLNGDNTNKKYYVYRLVDPRTFRTFYVGKGCGERVFQHVRDVTALYDPKEGYDAISLKSQQIADILSCGKQVISVIHRRGLTAKEALEVEAALIDAYPGLTNIQRGHGTDRGMMTVDDIYESVHAVDYEEPSENYVMIKTTTNAIGERGSLYEAVRQSWRSALRRAKKYKYVLAVVHGIVRGVYHVDEWYQDSPDRIAFYGHPVVKGENLFDIIGKRIPVEYRRKGLSNPFLYKK